MNAIKNLLSLKAVNNIKTAIFKKNLVGCKMQEDNSLALRTFSSLSSFSTKSLITNSIKLIPNNFSFISVRGMKIKGKLKRRCKECYYARIDGRMYILCDAFPRHKQAAMVKREKYTWILSHCMQSKKRPY